VEPVLRPRWAAEPKELKMYILNYKIMFLILKIVELSSQGKENSISNFGLLEAHYFLLEDVVSNRT